MKQKSIIFYGNDFTPLSNDCYGCYHYGSLCNGSVYERECRAGIVEDIRPSIIASLLLSFCANRFVLARSFGYNIENDIDMKDLQNKSYLYEEYEKAVNTPQQVIENYKNLYSINDYAEYEMHLRD